jgi:hypothetical protein
VKPAQFNMQVTKPGWVLACLIMSQQVAKGAWRGWGESVDFVTG